MFFSGRDHIAELQNTRPKRPFFFLKPPSSILVRGEGPVRRPNGVDLHFEVELAVIVGKEVRDLDEGDEKGAMDAVDCKSLPLISFFFFFLFSLRRDLPLVSKATLR